MASPRTVSGRASAERGRGRSQRASCGGGRLTGCCRDSDRPHATSPGPPAAAAHPRQSGDLDPDSRRSSCAASSTRSAARRVRPSSPRVRHQPELATARPNNGAITNLCCAVIRPLRRPQILHRTRIPLSPRPPLTHWRPGRSSGQRSAGLWPSLSRAHDGDGGLRTPFEQADPARSPVLARTPSEAGRHQANYPEHVRVSSPVSPAVPRARLRGGASHEAKGRRGAQGGRAGRSGATRRRLCVLRQILHELVAGLEQFLLVDDVVAVEDGAGLVAGQEHGDPLGDAGADQVAGGGAAGGFSRRRSGKPGSQRLGNRVRDRENPPHQRLRAGGREPDDAAGLVDLLPGEAEDLILAPAGVVGVA